MVDRSTRFAPTTLDALVELLSSRRVELVRCAEALRSEGTDALRSRDVSDLFDDEAPAEDSDVVTQLILIERTEDGVREVDAALARVADGTYGSCVDCGTDIPLRRLRALPAVATCVDCSDRDRSRGGPWLRAAGGEP